MLGLYSEYQRALVFVLMISLDMCSTVGGFTFKTGGTSRARQLQQTAAIAVAAPAQNAAPASATKRQRKNAEQAEQQSAAAQVDGAAGLPLDQSEIYFICATSKFLIGIQFRPSMPRSLNCAICYLQFHLYRP